MIAALPGGARAADHPRGVYGDSLRALLGSDVAGTVVGALAVSQDRGDTLFAWHEAGRLIPGSNAKLFPTGALWLEYGPDARRVTLVEARGEVKRKKSRNAVPEISLKGDLILRPCGMPDVVPLFAPGSKGLLDSLAVLLRAGGLRKLEGTLWIDRSLFAEEPPPPGWGYDDLAYGYGAAPTPLLANGNGVLLTATEDKGTVRLNLDPPEVPITVRDAGISVVDSGAAGSLTPRWAFGRSVVEITGTVPKGGSVRRNLAMTAPDSSAAVLFLADLKRAGVEVGKMRVGFVPAAGQGKAAKRKGDDVPEGPWPGWNDNPAVAGWEAVDRKRPAVVAGLPSPTLGEAIGVVNARSLNTEAEGLLHLAAPTEKGKTRRDGLAEVARVAAGAGIDTLDLSLVDGSGLSAQDLVTPRAVVRWLDALDRSPKGQGAFRASLAALGLPGTLENRVTTLPPGADVRAKTGTLTNVSALSGYVTTAAGEKIVFSILVNAARRSVAGARDAEDRVVRFLARVSKDRPGTMAAQAPPSIPR